MLNVEDGLETYGICHEMEDYIVRTCKYTYIYIYIYTHIYLFKIQFIYSCIDLFLYLDTYLLGLLEFLRRVRKAFAAYATI